MTPSPDLAAASDRHVVRSARAGREAAYGELVRRYGRRVRQSIYRIVHHTERTSDLEQETFVKAFRALDRYRSERRFLPWILTIANNAATDYIRRPRPDRGDSPWVVTPGYLDAQPHSLLDSTDSPTEQHERDDAAALRWALGRLKPEYLRCVTLRYIEGRSHDEIARMMGLTAGTVGSHLHRARKDLKRMMKSPQANR